MLRARNYAKTNNLDNLSSYINEAKNAETLKESFDKCVLEEVTNFNNLYAFTLTNLVNEFKDTVIELHSNVFYSNSGETSFKRIREYC